MSSLRKIVLEQTGYNLGKCQSCLFCDKVSTSEMDISFSTLVQMILFNDDEVLTTHTLWSDGILSIAANSCCNGFDLSKAILALRQEAQARGLAPKS
jgi:sulfur transfer complex TusBCD TusB component (DsrH family)